MSTPDHLLPVFSFRPNWKQGVTEKLEWLTSILTAKTSGAEQRVALRLTPRRAFEVTIEPLEADRTFFDLFLRRFAAAEFTLPLWHDRGSLTAGASSGATGLSFDTVNREFVSGGMALLMGANALDCEAVRLDAVSSGGATLLAPTTIDWSAGATIHPLRRARFDDKPDITNTTDRLASLNLGFELNQANDYDGGSEELDTFGGIPILSPAPNWSDEINLDYFREIEEIDNKVGLKALVDLSGRSFHSQMHRWMLEGREELAAFYRLLYRLRGRQGRIWLPSFTSDLILAAGASAGATSIDVVKCGLDYADFPDVGRNKAITSGGEVLSFSTLAASPGPGIERLNLSAPLVDALSTGDALQWVDIGRLDADRIELQHETDSDGITIIEAPFRTFSDTRDGSAEGVIPIPTATMTSGSCNDPNDIYPSLPLKFTAALPSPLPSISGLSSIGLFVIPVLEFPGGARVAKSIQAGMRKVVNWFAYNHLTNTPGASEGSVDNGPNGAANNFTVNFSIAWGGYTITGTFTKETGRITLLLNAVDGVDIRVVTDNWPDPLTVAPYDATLGFNGPAWLPTFQLQAGSDLHATYSAFNFDPQILVGPDEELISSKVQKWWQHGSISSWTLNYYVNWGSDPTSEFAEVVDV